MSKISVPFNIDNVIKLIYNISMERNENIVKKAFKFAKEKHSNQFFTDGSGTPYFEHCKRVCRNLFKYASGELDKVDILQATALLHDTLEDTDTCYDELLNEFGKEIADNVAALTKNDELPKGIQMEGSLGRIVQTSKEACLVKLADRITNLTQVHPLWGYNKAVNYLQEANMILKYLGGVNAGLTDELERRIERYKQEIVERFQNEK